MCIIIDKISNRMQTIKIANCYRYICVSVVGVATGYGLDDWGVGVLVPVGSRIFFSLNRPDRLWGPPNLSNGYRGHFPRGWSGRDVKLTTHLRLVLKSRKSGSIHPLPHKPSWRSAWIRWAQEQLYLFMCCHLRWEDNFKTNVEEWRVWGCGRDSAALG
jgi:hypothetical protein